MADVYNLQNDSIDYPDIEEVLERSRWDWLGSQDVHDIFTFHVSPTVSLDPIKELEEGLFMYSTLTDLDTHEWEPFDDGVIEKSKTTMEENNPMRYTVVHLSLDPIDEGIRSTYERRVYTPRSEYREYVLAHYRILNIANDEDSEYESGVDTEDSDDSSDDSAGFEGGHDQEEDGNEELDNVGEEADHGEAPPPPLCNGHCERLFQTQVAELRRFVEQLKSNPSILHDPSLIFFKEYLRSLGAQVPKIEKTERDYEDKAETKPSFFTNHDDDVMESDVELDNSDVVEPDNDPPQPMGDPTAEVTDENRDAAQSEKSKAMDAISDGKFDEAIEHLTKAILLNPTSAILYASRASAFLKVKKPNAAIRDANEALQFNPDSAKGYKSQGMARAMLGQWEEAAADLHLASKLDYDEEIGAMLKKVEPNAKRIEEHRRKYQRLRKEKELQRAERERRQQQEAQEREAQAALKDGQVISIHSTSELEAKTKAAKKASRLLILYFTATWCGPCRYMSPLYSNLATQHPRVVFLKVDIDEANSVAASWNISSVPTFCFIRDGKEVDKVVGADKGSLEQKIAQHSSSK